MTNATWMPPSTTPMASAPALLMAAALLAACGSEPGLDSAETDDPTTSTSASGMVGAGAGAQGGAGGSIGTGGIAGAGGDAVTGPPVVLTFGANVSSLTEGESIVFSAVLTDPDGIDDIVGGVLEMDGLPLGAFITSAQEGAYTLSVSWAAIHQTSAIDFPMTGSDERTFNATFFDQGGLKATAVTMVAMTCAGLASCDGTCKDLATNKLDCGACDHACTEEDLFQDAMSQGLGAWGNTVTCQDSSCGWFDFNVVVPATSPAAGTSCAAACAMVHPAASCYFMHGCASGNACGDPICDGGTCHCML